MMRAKADTTAASNTLLIVACLLLAGSAVAGILMPKPNDPTAARKAEDRRKEQEATVRSARAAGQSAKASVLSRTWSGEDASITSAILDLTTTLARKRGVAFVRLQPQRNSEGGALEQLPYLVVVEGPFPAVVAMERDLEVPSNRLGVNAFQISSSDSETNKVTASISIVAQRVGSDVEETEAKNGKSG